MGGRASRQKGMRLEYGLRDYMRGKGFKADRVPSSGAAQGFPGDVRIIGHGLDLLAECKSRQNAFKSIYGLFDGCGKQPLSLRTGNICIYLSDDFDDLGFGEPSYRGRVFMRDTENPSHIRTIKKLVNLHRVVKECDFLVLKINHRPMLFVRYIIHE